MCSDAAFNVDVNVDAEESTTTIIMLFSYYELGSLSDGSRCAGDPVAAGPLRENTILVDNVGGRDDNR